MRIGYFPGCSLLGTAQEYNESLHAVAKSFDIELKEIKDWNCCGATAAHNLNRNLAVALPARILALAEKQEFDEILAPCAACYNRLLSAWYEMEHEPELREKISKIVELPIAGTSKPLSVLEFLGKYVMPEMKNKQITPFEKKVACYYGCLLVRPSKLIEIERFEDPLVMEKIMETSGATPVKWAFKTECCGASLSIARTDIVAKLSGKIVDDATSRGAEAIVVACPMCQSNLDMRRPQIDEYLKRRSEIPVLYITQVIGLSLGLSYESLGFKRHFVPVDPVLKVVQEV